MPVAHGLARLSATIALAASLALAYSDYEGYSGAPGTLGACAGSCHGTLDGSMTVTGFPVQYVPGQAYTIRLGHDSGPAIWNFNASARIGTGSQTAGVISAGLYTETYSVPTESNGVHMPTYGYDTCSFVWTAPSPGVGDVRLYVAGHQDHTTGPNTTLVLLSNEAAGVRSRAEPLPVVRFRVEPTVTSGPVSFHFSSPKPGPVVIHVTDATGRILASFSTDRCAAGEQLLVWPALDSRGRRLPAGSYLVRARFGGQLLVRNIVLKGR
ncbi:MAG TPA: hypothetical protein VMH22_12140 [bacterium]|nr:hypothetical protein [bacterium]